MKTVIVVCAVIQDVLGRYLVSQRKCAEDGPLAGKWGFAGGKMEREESPEQALWRELREELGLSCTIGDKLSPVVHAYSHVRVVLLPYRATIAWEQTIQTNAHEQHRWVFPEQFGTLDWAAADIPILEQLT